MVKVVVLSMLVLTMSFASLSYSEETYLVQKGDTLYSLSKRFGVTVEDIKRANNLESIALQVNQQLTIPSTQAPNWTSQGAAQKVNSNVTKTELPKYHVVQTGDTLRSIAQKYNLKQEELLTLNRDAKPRRLNIGQKILLSRSSRPTMEETKPIPSEAKQDREAPSAPKIHVVKKGENLYQIARKYNLSVEELKTLNNLNSNSLKTGQDLIVSRQDIAHSDDALGSIRSYYIQRRPAVVNQSKIREVQELSKAEDLAHLDIKERLILFAKKLLHLPYSFGGSGALGIDCSSFVQKVYSTVGINLPRSAREQFRIGEEVKKDDLAKGDLVFFRTYASFPSHVGIYLGNNLFIHASTLSKKVTIDTLDAPYYVKRYIGAKRLLTEEEAKRLSTEPLVYEN